MKTERELAPAGLLKIKDQSKPFRLETLQNQFKNICYLSTSSLFTNSPYGKNVSCTSLYDGQWMTQKTSSIGQPLVGLLSMSFSRSFQFKDEMLHLHESLGALGLTDDEYQISASLIALSELEKNKKATVKEILLSKLQSLETHTDTPIYKSGATEGCYRWFRDENGVMLGASLIKKGSKEAKEILVAGGANHIGGGGDPAALLLKVDALLTAEAYWMKKKLKGASADDFKKFVHALLEIGIESLEHFDNSGAVIFPIQIHFANSKRQFVNRKPKPAIYLLTNRLIEYRSSPQTWNTALEHIHDHVYCTRLHSGNDCQIQPITMQLWNK